jgi:hypothetical protein
VLAKASPGQKIDATVASVITHEAAGDVTAAGEWDKGGLTRVKGRASAY